MGQVGTNERAKVLSDDSMHLLKYMIISLAWNEEDVAPYSVSVKSWKRRMLSVHLSRDSHLNFSHLRFPRSS